jgi:hypothetical protein
MTGEHPIEALQGGAGLPGGPRATSQIEISLGKLGQVGAAAQPSFSGGSVDPLEEPLVQ